MKNAIYSLLLISFLALASCGKPAPSAIVQPWSIQPTDFGSHKIHGIVDVKTVPQRYLEIRFRSFDKAGNQRGMSMANIESPTLGPWAYEITIAAESDRVELIGVFSSPNSDVPIN